MHDSPTWADQRKAELELADVCAHLNKPMPFAFAPDMGCAGDMWTIIPQTYGQGGPPKGEHDCPPYYCVMAMDMLHVLHVDYHDWQKGPTHFEFRWNLSSLKDVNYHGDNRPAARISRKKTPALIAAELCRRFFPDYWTEYPALVESQKQAETFRINSKNTLLLFGCKIPSHVPDQRKGWFKIKGQEFDTDIEVNGKEVSRLTFKYLTREQAAALVSTLAALNKE